MIDEYTEHKAVESCHFELNRLLIILQWKMEQALKLIVNVSDINHIGM